MRSDFCSSHFQVSQDLDESFQVSQDLDKSFQDSQDLDEVWFLFQVIFKSLKTWMRSDFCFKSFSSVSRLG